MRQTVEQDTGGPPEPLRVVIADDHPFYRRGLARMLRRTGIEVVNDVPSAEAAIRAVGEAAPDVVIMDLKMPGLSGLEATRRLAADAPDSPVLVLSASAEEEDVADAILAGASGYVLKDGPVEEVVGGIRAAAAGQSLISPGIATALLRRVRDLTSAGVDVRLSDHEVVLLELLAKGKDTQEVADALGITGGTARTHISNILMKLQVANGVHAAVGAGRERNSDGS